MDLHSFYPLESLSVKITHQAIPTGEEPIFTLSGPSHAATVEAKKAYLLALANGASLEEALIEYLATRVINWDNVIWDNTGLLCSKENVLMVLSQPGLEFIKWQLLAKAFDYRAFFAVAA